MTELERAALLPRFQSEGGELLRLGALLPLHLSPSRTYSCPLQRDRIANRYMGAARTEGDLTLLLHVYRPDALALACDVAAEFVAARGPAGVFPFERKPFGDEAPQTIAILDERDGSITWLFNKESLLYAVRQDIRFIQETEFVVVPPSTGFTFVSDVAVLANAPIQLQH